MIVPLKKLIAYNRNMYEVTCAAIKRAIQINLSGDDELEKANGKIVSLALKQVLSNDVEYRLED